MADRARRRPVRIRSRGDGRTAHLDGAVADPGRAVGIASAVNNAISRVSGLVAVAFLGVIAGGALTVDGFHRVVVVVALLLGASAVVSFVGLRGGARTS